MAQNNTIQYTITAKDQASAVFAQVAQKSKGTGAAMAESFAMVGAAAFAMRGTIKDGLGVLSGDFTKLGSLLGALPGPIGVVGQAVGDTMGRILDSTIKAADGYRRLSEQTGASIEFLSRFSEAADDVFVSQEAVTAGFTIFAKKLGGVEDAMDGSGVSAGAFAAKLREIGITSDDMEESVLQVADRFKEMPNGADKAALSVQLFGKRGTELIPILNKGRDGIKEMGDAAEALGLTMDTKTSKAVERLKQRQDSFNDTLKGTETRLGKELIPTFLDWTEAQQLANKETGGMLGPLRDLKALYLQLNSANYQAAQAVKTTTNNVKEFGEWALDVTPPVSAFIGIVGQGGDAFAEMQSRMVTTNGAILGFSGAMSDAVQPTQEMKDAALGVNGAVGEMPIAFDNAMKAALIYKLSTGQLAFETFKQETATRAVTKALADGKLTTEEAAALYQGLADKSIKTEDALRRTGQAGKDAATLIDQMNDSMNRVKSKDVSLTFTAFRTPMFNDAVGTWDAIQNKSVTVTFNTVSGTNVESDFGGNTRAKGGPVKKSKPYLVGEQGPEMFVPYASGYIVPNNATPYTDPGHKVNQSFNVNNPGIIINSANGAAVAQQIARANANVARRARARASLTG